MNTPLIARLNLRSEQLRELGLVLVIVGIVLFFGTQIPRYYTESTFTRIADSVAIITVVAVGMTLVVLTRNIDLSVGSIVGLTAFMVGRQLSTYQEMTPAVAVLLALGIGALLGLINGLLVAFGKVPAIVITLGTLAIYRGYLFEYSDNSHITTQNLPTWIVDLPRQVVFNIGDIKISVLVAIALIVVVIFQLILIYLPAARHLYAIGSDPETAQTSGIPQRRLVLMAFVVCGALAGLGGFMYLAKIGTITTVAAQGMELQVVAAVVLGGINIFGGSGRVIGALLGAILMGTIEQGLIRMRINEFWKLAIQGLAILLAVASDAVLLTRVRVLLARSRSRRMGAATIITTSEQTGLKQ